LYNKKIARRYTASIYGPAEEKNITDAIRNDFILIKNTIEVSRDLKLFLSTPVISTEKKKAVFKEIFNNKLEALTFSLIELVFDKNRENLLYDISSDFLELYNEKSGIIEAKIKTAIELSADEKKNITGKLTQYTGKKIEASYAIDPDIKGGFIARIEDTIIDASIRRQLELLFENFKKGSFKNN